jgi:hypothetical protein
MTEPQDDREFGPPISRNKRIVIGISMIAALVFIVAIVFFSSGPRL